MFISSQLKALDQYTIEHEPVASIDLMERASQAVTNAICERWSVQTPVIVFAGPGNNGGDALAVARMLAERQYGVQVYLFNVHGTLSADCAVNKERVESCQSIDSFTEITTNFDPPVLTSDTLVIDGLFGIGLNKPLTGGFAALVKYINQSKSQVVSIDLPSGLMAEDNTYNIKSNIIRARLTLTFHQKKLSMLMADNQIYVGEVEVLDIGLSAEGAQQLGTPFSLVDANTLKPLLLQRETFAHKGSMGHALLVAGSYGMAGAAVLATQACLKAGAGKVTASTPRSNVNVLQSTVPEAIMDIQPHEEYFVEPIPADDYDAMGIGPGLGQLENTAIALIAQLRRTACPIVADADALNILSNHRAWLQQVPKHIIMTPHPKEFDRMVGMTAGSCYDRLMKAKEMAVHSSCFVVLKGHYTAICTPQGEVAFNTTGNAGMATAGCGDVLTGLLTGLLARGYLPETACKLGVYLHGLAGDLAANEVGLESLTASDVVRFIPQAFKQLMKL